MRARYRWWTWPLLVLGLAACGSDDDVVDPGTGNQDPVVWMLTGDHSGEAHGGRAVLRLHSEGSESIVNLVLEVDDGSTLLISSPPGMNRVEKTVYDVTEDDDDEWSGRLILKLGNEFEWYAALDGFLAIEALSDDAASGFFSLDTQEVDSEGELVSGGLEVSIQGTFTANIERTSPGSRAVMKGSSWLPIAALTRSF